MLPAAEAPGPAAPLEAWLRWQEKLNPRPIELGLERVREVAGRLYLPDARIRSVTVAGTNGKGSSARLLAEIYRAAGYRVGGYLSPHVLRYNERVTIAGRDVSDEALCGAFAAVESARGGTPLTYFEFGTLAALWLFARAEVQVQVLEVGLGGRLDAVNIVDADCALVTSIGLDHREYLGDDRERIGFEKSGIMRRGRPAVCADPDPPRSVGEHAGRLGVGLRQIGRDYAGQPVADAWNWRGWARSYRKLPPPALKGATQLQNAAGAIAAVESLQECLPVSEAAIRAGLVRARLPGRFDVRGHVILDVAHNVEAARALAENLRAANARRPVRLVLGMLSDKPVEAFVAVLAPLVERIYAGGLPEPRGLDGAALAGRARTVAGDVVTSQTVAEAFERASADSAGVGTLLVCGSFLTVAAVLERMHG